MAAETPTWIPLVSALVGGVIASTGAAITQALTHRFTRSREIDAARRGYLERMAKSIYAHCDWLTTNHFAMIHGRDTESLSPIGEAQMLQSLYFPELDGAFFGFLEAGAAITKFDGEQTVERLKDYNKWATEYDLAPYNEAYTELLREQDTLLKRIRALVPVVR